MSEGQGEEESVSFDELAESQNPRDEDGSTGHGRRRAAGPVRRRRRRGPLRMALPVLLVLLVLGGLGVGGVFGYQWLTSNVSLEKEDPDFPGPGSGEALVQVAEGDTGTDIAKTLVDAGVIKTTGPFITQFSNSPDASGIEPGLYRLKKEMTSSDALTMILDPANVAGHRVIVPEGLRAEKIWAVLSEATDIPVEDFEAAAKDYTSFGVPENDAKSLEGYLWPGRYDVPEGATAGEVISMMTDRMQTELEKLGVAPEDEHRVLTLASIAEKEARDPDDYGRVVRTLENRLEGVGEAKGKPMKLQFDSTVHYAAGKSGSVATTDEERASDNPYNTYRFEGLPPGPIAAPGAGALDAAVDPPEGDWLYFVSVNGDTGETKFTANWSEHEKNVKEWQAWEASH